MNDFENILLEVKAHRANIIINRPEKRNALNHATIAELVSAFEYCQATPEIRVVVLSGAGDKAFCAGADLSETLETQNEFLRFTQRETFLKLWQIIPGLGKPVIASVQGAALAGGCGLAASCDFVIASTNARFGTPEINVGMFPMMISAILVQNMGRKKAYDLMFTGRQIDAYEAERAGLVTRVVPAEQLANEVDSLATDLAAKSTAIMKLGKDALYHAASMSFTEAQTYLSAMLSLTIMTEDSKEGLRAFVEKRPPEFKGQ